MIEITQIIRLATMAAAGFVASAIAYIFLIYFSNRAPGERLPLARHVVLASISYLILVLLVIEEVLEKFQNKLPLIHVGPFALIALIAGIISLVGMLKFQSDRACDRRSHHDCRDSK